MDFLKIENNKLILDFGSSSKTNSKNFGFDEGKIENIVFLSTVLLKPEQ